MKYIFQILLVLIFNSGFAQNLHKLDASYLEEGEQILSEFYASDENSIRPRLFNLKFFRKFNLKNCCCGKRKITRLRNKDIEKRYINAYDRLPSRDKAFFEKINKLTAEAESGKTLYYKITNYWLLPAQAARNMTDWSDLINKNGYADGWNVEQRFDEAVLLFLAEKGHLKKFKDLERLVITIQTTSVQFMEDENKTDALDEFEVKLKSYSEFMYVRSKSMLTLIERL